MKILPEILKTEKQAKLCDFVCVAYDSPTRKHVYMLDVHLDDVDDDAEILMRPGDVILLPRNQRVINSLKHGVLNYFTTMGVGDEAPPLSAYSMKYIDMAGFFKDKE